MPPTMHVSRRPLSTSALGTSLSPPKPTTPSHRYSDRFIPSRAGSGDLQAAFELLRHPPSSPSSENTATVSNLPHSPPTLPTRPSPPNCYSLLLKSELLDAPPPPPTLHLSTPPPSSAHAADHFSTKRPSLRHATLLHPGLEGLKRLSGSSTQPSHPHVGTPSHPPSNIFRFQTPPRPNSADASTLPARDHGSPFAVGATHARNAILSATVPGRVSRKISRTPFKVLDAPSLADDFYLNLVDWSAQNVLAVGLKSCVYLWSACTSVVTKLCDLQRDRHVTSVSWNQSGNLLAVGTSPGVVQVWDTTTCKLVRTLKGHSARVGCLAWNSSILSSGGRDKEIFNRDMRCKEDFVAQLSGHKQEVCGLTWSNDDMQLASGGNDNQLLIWNASAGLGCGGTSITTGSGASYNSPALAFSCHEAAVKAIAWSPHARGLLVSGGGTADRKIRFWNTMTNSALAVVDTGSQVCNLAWSKNVNEVVSTHGYSQNQVIVWKYPTLSKVVTLMGHTCRVLYLAMSPSGETIVTGAGDETLRFWNVFPSAKSQRGSCDSSSLLSPGRMSIR